MNVQKTAARFLTCVAGTVILAAGCKKVDYGYRQPTVEERGNREFGVNIVGPQNVSNVTIKVGENKYDQYRASATGRYKMVLPYASSFVVEANRLKDSQLLSPQSTTGFALNSYGIVEMIDLKENKTIRYLSEMGGAVVYKGKDLKSDSLNTHVNSGILNNSRWDVN